ncbi:ORC1-type DNA replication protein [Candidatus Woesearchaeota archaeon]|nr:ORC1-type DNA replication protein [Candidatus Woesearchaeota archaeon]MCF7900779.1 ORC1-type DNA replication protein [Candidatus Woesearchaeota archaeon]MCF8013081.1 ORC1-type DNA replication protein [Candidatus Woesearchaeota archaeon]
MVENNLNNFFEKFLKKDSLFSNKKVLQSSYMPGEINHRDDQINQIAQILAPALKTDKPSNLFIYGKTGTGKTLISRHVAEQMENVAKQRDIPLQIFYLNCKLKKIADTEYRLIAELARFFGKAIPPTGLPTDEVYNIFFSALEQENKIIILILDEIDQLIKKAGDEIIYNLTRINQDLKKSQLSIIGISNDLMFANNLDPRVKSSLSEEEIVFPPYNAVQIQEILKKRAEIGFKSGTIEDGVIQKCAAYAAREHGDARRALELLRVAGEIAERKNQEKLLIENIDEAEDKIERDRMIDMVKTHPKQFQATLYPILLLSQQKDNNIFTGDIYELYKDICSVSGLRPLTQRRVSDIIAELDMLGIINAKVISKGRFGRTREISLSLSKSIEKKILTLLDEELGISDSNREKLKI